MRILSIASLILVAACGGSTAQTNSGLEWGACDGGFDPSAECGWYTTLEDRANVEGRSIDIRVVVLPAQGEPKGEPVLFFPGGPGQATPDLVPIAAAYPGIRSNRDLIFIGQRGTGESNPLHCPVDIAAEPSRAFAPIFDTDNIRSCWDAAGDHADPSFYTTEEYVADIADVLDALGHSKALLWGGSGGTRTALAFMRAHEQRVVAAVLDGVTSLDYTMPVPFARFAQSAWDHVVEDCAAQPECAAAYPRLDADLQDLLVTLHREPARTSVVRADGSTVDVEFGAWDLGYAIRGILYNAGLTARLPRQVSTARESGDLQQFAQATYERSVTIRSNVLAMGLHLTIYCAEDVPRIDEGEAREAVEGTFLGDYLIGEYSNACTEWPVRAKSDDWYHPVQSDLPVLLLSGYYDPSTPAQSAEHVRQHLPNSRHIVVRNSGHGAGFSCARPAVERFLTQGSFEGFEDSCPDTPIRFETR